MHLVPGVAGRGVHITDVQLVRARDHPFGHQMAAADHQGMAGQVELLDRQGQQRQVLLDVAHPQGSRWMKLVWILRPDSQLPGRPLSPSTRA